MKIWRLLVNVFFVAIAVIGVIWQESSLGTATVLGTTGIGVIASLGAALVGEFVGVIIDRGDFCKKSYFISVAVGVVFALVLSLIVL